MTEVMTRQVAANEDDLNRDTNIGIMGAHPLDRTAGAATGGAIGSAAGAADAVNPMGEEEYWRETFMREHYHVAGRPFEFYAPAFRAGWEGRVRHNGRRFEAVESEMKTNYERSKGEIDPSWLDVRPAARAAWDRVDLYWKAGQ